MPGISFYVRQHYEYAKTYYVQNQRPEGKKANEKNMNVILIWDCDQV